MPSMAKTWAQRLKRVFNIDVETCVQCGGSVKVIPNAFATLTGQALACIEDQPVIDKILSHLRKKDRLPSRPDLLPEARRHHKPVCLANIWIV